MKKADLIFLFGFLFLICLMALLLEPESAHQSDAIELPDAVRINPDLK